MPAQVLAEAGRPLRDNARNHGFLINSQLDLIASDDGPMLSGLVSDPEPVPDPRLDLEVYEFGWNVRGMDCHASGELVVAAGVRITNPSQAQLRVCRVSVPDPNLSTSLNENDRFNQFQPFIEFSSGNLGVTGAWVEVVIPKASVRTAYLDAPYPLSF